ncbi:MAG: MFS transporter, partial [Luminiphilus sp.]
PALLLSPWFGILSDRVNPREGLRLSMVIHSAITLTGTLTTWLGWYDRAALLALAGTLGVATSLHSPMRLALVPLLVTREALPSAVGYSAMSFNIARMVGPALGAALVAQVNVSAAWLTAMMMFMVSFWGLSRLTIERDAPAVPSSSFVDQLVAGFRHLLGRSDLRLLLALTAVNGLLGRTIIELLPALSGQVLQGGSAELAVLVAMAGLGSVLGGLLVSRQAADLARLMALVCAAIMLAGLALISLQWFAGLVGLALWVSMLSVVTTVAGTGSQTLIQLTASAEYRGRVMSVWTMLAMGAPALGAALLGAGVDGFGFSRVAIWTGCAGIVLVIGLYARRSRVLADGDP